MIDKVTNESEAQINYMNNVFSKPFNDDFDDIEVFHDEDEVESHVMDKDEIDSVREEYNRLKNDDDTTLIEFFDKDGDITYHSEIVNEAYFGRKYTDKAFTQFCLIREIAKNIKSESSHTFNTHKEVVKFNRIIEDTFGFRTFALSLSPSFSINAYAIPIFTYLSNSAIEKAKKSISMGTFLRFDKYGEIVAYSAFNKGTFDADFLSNEQLFAILLHEIGHMFFETIVDPTGRYGTTNALQLSCSYISDAIRRDIVNPGEPITNKSIIDNVDKYVSGARVAFDNIKNIIKAPFSSAFSITKLLRNKMAVKESMLDNLKNARISSYTNEKFADTFAAMNGYGPELHSALLAMSKDFAENHVPTDKAQPKGTLARILAFPGLMFDDWLAFVLNVKDEHPDGLARINVGIQYLKREIAKDGIDPKLKEDLLEQLDILNKEIERYIEYTGSDKDKLSIYRAYYVYLYKKFGGDRRESVTDNKALFDAIDQTINELKKS